MAVGRHVPDSREVSATSRHEEAAGHVLVFTIVAFALLMTSVDSTIVATALDAIQQGLGTSVNWAGWTITAYSVGIVLMLPVSSKLSEWYGHRRVFLASVMTFTLASLCCGLVNSIYLLIVLRALQAAGGAGITPSVTGIIVDHFGDQRDRAVSLFGSVFPVGAMIGPVFGGLFVSLLSWRYIFFVNVPIGAVVIALSLRYIPHDLPRPHGARLEMDVPGMALLGAGLLGGMLAMSYLGEKNAGATSPLFIVPLAIAVVGMWIFFRHIRRTGQPFIAPRFIYGAEFSAVNLINVIYIGVTSGVIALIPLYAANRFKMSALASGTLLIAEGVAAIAFSVAATLALRRSGYRPPLLLGGVIIAAGMVLLALPPLGVSPYIWLALAAFVIGIGGGVVNPASRNAGLQLVPEHSAVIAALRTVGIQVGQIVTVSVATALLANTLNPSAIQARYYVATAIVLLIALPLIIYVPEHHGSW